MVCTSRRYSGDAQFARAVHFTHAAPTYRAEYDPIFRVPVAFESDRNAIATDDGWMSRRTETTPGSRHAAGILSAHADEELDRLERSKSMRGRVESLLMPVLHNGGANMAMSASKLGLSRQSLFRKLKAEGVTFEKVPRRFAPHDGAPLPAREKDSGERERLPCRILRSCRVLTRIQTVDRVQSPPDRKLET